MNNIYNTKSSNIINFNKSENVSNCGDENFELDSDSEVNSHSSNNCSELLSSIKYSKIKNKIIIPNDWIILNELVSKGESFSPLHLNHANTKESIQEELLICLEKLQNYWKNKKSLELTSYYFEKIIKKCIYENILENFKKINGEKNALDEYLENEEKAKINKKEKLKKKKLKQKEKKKMKKNGNETKEKIEINEINELNDEIKENNNYENLIQTNGKNNEKNLESLSENETKLLITMGWNEDKILEENSKMLLQQELEDSKKYLNEISRKRENFRKSIHERFLNFLHKKN